MFSALSLVHNSCNGRLACQPMMQIEAPVKKRGLPPGESDGGVPSAPAPVVGRVAALDFLGLSDDYERRLLGFNFAYYREAEIKHGRLAMLAAVAWPLQEILHPIFVGAFYEATGVRMVDALAASNGASPSLLNGGLFQLEVLPALLLFTAGCARLEQSDQKTRASLELDWNEYSNNYGAFGRTPGDFRFDPLNFYKPLTDQNKVEVQERELLNGRVAMLAVGSYVATEFVTKMPVVDTTPLLFQPIIFSPWFRSFMDASFSMAGTPPN